MLSVTESGSDLTLLTWTCTIGGRPTSRARGARVPEPERGAGGARGGADPGAGLRRPGVGAGSGPGSRASGGDGERGLGRASDLCRGRPGRTRRDSPGSTSWRARRRLVAGGDGRRTGCSGGLPTDRRRGSSGSPTWGVGRRDGWPQGRPRTRERRSTPRWTSSSGRATRSATWRGPGSTCGTSSTGTVRSTRCATRPSRSSVSWDATVTGRSRPAPASRGATPVGAGARSTSSPPRGGRGPASRWSGSTTASRTRRRSTARPSPGGWR